VVGGYDLINVKANRSPFVYARALNPNGIYAIVVGNTPACCRRWLWVH
jgi:hypothetical protein